MAESRATPGATYRPNVLGHPSGAGDGLNRRLRDMVALAGPARRRHEIFSPRWRQTAAMCGPHRLTAGEDPSGSTHAEAARVRGRVLSSGRRGLDVGRGRVAARFDPTRQMVSMSLIAFSVPALCHQRHVLLYVIGAIVPRGQPLATGGGRDPTKGAVLVTVLMANSPAVPSCSMSRRQHTPTHTSSLSVS